jgi:protein-S-isoprenylcysteine O-methyltransferase Ste14
MTSSLELRIPPVLLAALAAFLMWLLSLATPPLAIENTPRLVLVAACLAASAITGLAGVIAFRRARTTVNPMAPEHCSALVESGIFRFTRNPMYLSLLLALLGWAVFLRNPWTSIIAIGFVLYMNRYQIRPEEQALGAAFGDAFEQYRLRVRRWL